jgi:hypothetical protein
VIRTAGFDPAGLGLIPSEAFLNCVMVARDTVNIEVLVRFLILELSGNIR